MILRMLIIAAALSAANAAEPTEPTTEAVTRIAVGSCHAPGRHDPWPAVLAWQPQQWLWTGDAVYHDSAVAEVQQAHYAAALASPNYAQLVATVPVDGTWDDHDYGRNNAGGEFPGKDVSQTTWLDFIGIAADDPRRARAGVYHAFDLGATGQQVRVILLDTRYYRDAPSATGDILGADQWAWLTDQLRSSNAQAHILVSSIQVLPSEHPYECWARFPAARERLLALLAEHPVPGLVLVSGDRHIGEVSRLDREGLPPLWELTASGLTKAWGNFPGEPNQLRQGAVTSVNHFGGVAIDWAAGNMHLSLNPTGGGEPSVWTISLDSGLALP